MPAMTSKERVLAACAFEAPDRIPRLDHFWEFSDAWRERFGGTVNLNDVCISCPDEGAFPTRARVIEETAEYTIQIDRWGQTVRSRRDAYFDEVLDVPLGPGVDIDAVEFDPPDLDSRYLYGAEDAAGAAAAMARHKQDFCVFGKTGGPYMRTTFVRGDAQFLTDIAGDPPLAKALADKMADHLTAVGLEELRRWDLCDTGIWIYDDMAYNAGPMFSPASFERIFLPAYRRMIQAYKGAGAKYVFLHCDGNPKPLLDMLVDAGIDGLNPLEPRAGMDVVELRERYPNLIFAGGMDNSDTLINGPVARIEAEAKRIIDLGRDGGVIIGTHSISPEIPLEHFAAFDRVCRTYGDFSSGQA